MWAILTRFVRPRRSPPQAYSVRPIGWVHSPLTDVSKAPRQPDEGAPRAEVHFLPEYAEALRGLASGDQLIVVTWLDRASRDVLRVHPRGDESRPTTGVFATRSASRPNPIGLHDVTVVEVSDLSIVVDHLEAVHRTPVLDVKPRLGAVESR